LSASASALLLSGFATVSEKTDAIPWRELHMACVVTATNDFEFELLSGLATRTFLGPSAKDITQAVQLEEILERNSATSSTTDNATKYRNEKNKKLRMLLQKRRERGMNKVKKINSLHWIDGGDDTEDDGGRNTANNTRGTNQSSVFSDDTFYDATSNNYDIPTTITGSDDGDDGMKNLTDLSHLEMMARSDPNGIGTITRAKFELGLHTISGRNLLVEIQKQLWKRLPDELQLVVRNNRCESTKMEILRLEKIVFQPGVTNMFQKYKPRIRFNMWRRLKNLRKSNVLAIQYDNQKKRKFGIYCLYRCMLDKRRKRRLNWLADRHSTKIKYVHFMKHWKIFTLIEIEEREAFLKVAVEMWRKTMLRLRLYNWRIAVRVFSFLYIFIHFFSFFSCSSCSSCSSYSSYFSYFSL
jgi:hypothetical protein